MKKSAWDIIRELRRTEKATKLAARRQYFFTVDRQATKPQIRRAVESLFKVKVERVHTAVLPGKPRRVGAQWGLRPDWKRAIVTLAEGSKIEIAT